VLVDISSRGIELELLLVECAAGALGTAFVTISHTGSAGLDGSEHDDIGLRRTRVEPSQS
jgi:hypothetical protein